jgi:siroheme synthase (precorrin-2 oxidase/ferrochelatase)
VSCQPITLVGLEDARCLVIGYGDVESWKRAALCEASAQPVVLSQTLRQGGRIAYV